MHSTVAAWQLAITAAQHLVGPLCFHHQLTSVFFSRKYLEDIYYRVLEYLANIKYLPPKNVEIRNKPTHALNVTLYE